MSASERRQTVASHDTSSIDVGRAADWLRRGGIVAFPTDTFYGLAVDPGSSDALDDLFELKGREPSMAVPLIAASRAQVDEAFGTLTGLSATLARAFWPGPLSLVLDAPSWVAPEVHAGRRTIAVRVPDHAVARALADAFGRPITATSANQSGRRPATDVAGLSDLTTDSRLFVLDGGPTPGGAPSTLVDARGTAPVCLRAGAIAWDRVVTSR